MYVRIIQCNNSVGSSMVALSSNLTNYSQNACSDAHYARRCGMIAVASRLCCMTLRWHWPVFNQNKSLNATTPYPKMIHHSEQKCANIYSERCILGYGTDLWNWYIQFTLELQGHNGLIKLWNLKGIPFLALSDELQYARGDLWNN